jgi:hypothetical protein
MEFKQVTPPGGPMDTKLSPAMRKAIADAAPCGTVCGASKHTQYALIRRGLAVAVYGDETRPNRYGNGTRTYRNIYLGAKLVKK